MEAVRPQVDAYLIDLIRSHRFRAADFHETRKGDCRLLSPLTHVLATTSDTWAKHLAPVIEEAASALLSAASNSRKSRLPTPLTQRRRSEGRGKAARRTQGPERPATHACLDCANQIPSHRKRCEQCDQRFQAERLRGLGKAELKAMRLAGNDPNKTPSARKAVGDANREHWKARNEWNPSGQPTDPEYFRQEILPGLRELSPREISRMTGLSIGYCRLIKKGDKTPHPRHWRVLAGLGHPG